ncbi:MAG: glycosyltransferase family 2 protein [Candidatus Adiutrix sp.]|jgi:glycosyltransferase involved in cell wall biosynthesis|nr:glycosyltransferase family 2 protein [Candidatus Adiutrix sp.]
MRVLTVAILLGSYNGAAFLAEQLDSLAAQTYPHWRLWVSDDGSTDDTLKILKDYQGRWGQDKLTFGPGPGRGFVQNFLSPTANPEIEADYYAWCDQDDIWLPGKLSRALAQLAPGGQEKPALYGGRTILVDRDNREFGLSPLFNRPPSFANALVQSIMGGNTMIFNCPARSLIKAGYPLGPVSHDWWAYQLVSGAGGQVIYDEEPQIRYRQHGRNMIGSNQGWPARLARLRRMLKGNFRQWNERNLAALSTVADRLTAASRRELEAFSNLRRAVCPWQRWRQLKNSGLYREGRGQKWALQVATLMKQV